MIIDFLAEKAKREAIAKAKEFCSHKRERDYLTLEEFQDIYLSPEEVEDLKSIFGK